MNGRKMKNYRHKLNTLGYSQRMLLFGIIALAMGVIFKCFHLDIIGWIGIISGALAIVLLFLLVAIELHQDKVLNEEAIAADAKLEAAVKKKSFALPYNGGEIWSEHLDGLYTYKEIVFRKFERDIPEMMKPSAPSAIAVALAETKVDKEILNKILDTYLNADKIIRRVAFVGLDRRSQKQLQQLLNDASPNVKFEVYCTEDFEKAKEWLV